MTPDLAVGLALAVASLAWLVVASLREARRVDPWDAHVAQAVALNERVIYDDLAAELVADEAEAWLRGRSA